MAVLGTKIHVPVPRRDAVDRARLTANVFDLALREVLAQGPQPDLQIFTLSQLGFDRGEIDLPAIPPSVLSMPFDLVRHDLFMHRKPVKASRIRAIVDELILPLVARAARPATRRRA